MAQIQSIFLGDNTFFEDAEMPTGPSLMLFMTRPLWEISIQKKFPINTYRKKNVLERNVFFLTFLKIPFLQINGSLRIKQMLQTISF